MSSKSPALQRYPDLSALGDVFLFELTNEDGKLWTPYIIPFRCNEYFSKVIYNFNDNPTTQHIMLWATNRKKSGDLPYCVVAGGRFAGGRFAGGRFAGGRWQEMPDYGARVGSKVPRQVALSV